MIVSTSNFCDRYFGLNPFLDRALQWMINADFENLAVGRHEIEGASIYANVSEYTTKSVEQCGWESHRKYVDIQFIHSGSEIIDVADLSRLKVKVPYNTETDFLALEGELEQSVRLTAGQFAVLFPEDGHRPGIHGDRLSAGQVKKIVIKVQINP